MIDALAPGIWIEDHAFAREFHTRVALTDKGIERDYNNPTGALIMPIPGVLSVSVTRYSVTILKSPMFTWEEMTPAILERIPCEIL